MSSRLLRHFALLLIILRLNNVTVAVHSSSGAHTSGSSGIVTPSASHSPYANESTRISKYRDNAALKKLGIKYDPSNPLCTEQLCRIKDSFLRARLSHPDEKRVFSVGRQWVVSDELNGDYVERISENKRKKSEIRSRKERDERLRVLQTEGKLPARRATLSRNERMKRIRSTNPNDICMLNVRGRQDLRPDPLGRTNAEYLRELRVLETNRSRQQRARKESRGRDRSPRGRQLKQVSVWPPSHSPERSSTPSSPQQRHATIVTPTRTPSPPARHGHFNHSSPQSPDWNTLDDIAVITPLSDHE